MRAAPEHADDQHDLHLAVQQRAAEERLRVVVELWNRLRGADLDDREGLEALLPKGIMAASGARKLPPRCQCMLRSPGNSKS